MVWVTIHDSREDKHHEMDHCVAPFQSKASRARTFAEHSSSLNIFSQPSQIRLTGIICTIGPACIETDIMIKMIEAGMNIACVNLACGIRDSHAEAIQKIRKANSVCSDKFDSECSVAIAAIIRGPVIRLGFAVGGRCEEIHLPTGKTITLTVDEVYMHKGSSEVLFVDYEHLPRVVKIGGTILLDDGRITLICENICESEVICRIKKGGYIESRKRVYLPGVSVDTPAVTQKDKADLLFALEQKVDIIFASFIRNASAVKEIREIVGEKTPIVAKIENEEGLLNIDEIITAADGIIIARDRLGIEIPPEQIFLVQKAIIAKCNLRAKPVICTSHLLESMMRNLKPTRAETADAANAVIDGTDCLMLVKATAKGDHPVQAIQAVANICKEAESAFWREEFISDLFFEAEWPVDALDAIAMTAADTSVICGASAIVVVTSSIRSARLLSEFRPRCPIIAVVRDVRQARKAHLHRGILPVIYRVRKMESWFKDMKSRIYHGINFGRKKGFINSGDLVVTLTPTKQGSGFTDKLKIIQVSKPEWHGTVCVC